MDRLINLAAILSCLASVAAAHHELADRVTSEVSGIIKITAQAVMART